MKKGLHNTIVTAAFRALHNKGSNSICATEPFFDESVYIVHTVTLFGLFNVIYMHMEQISPWPGGDFLRVPARVFRELADFYIVGIFFAHRFAGLCIIETTPPSRVSLKTSPRAYPRRKAAT